MRALLAFSVISGVSALASADPPKPTVVWQDRVIAPPAGEAALTSVSHKLYLNDCRPNGCVVSPGADSSLTNRSSIPVSTVTLSPYGHGQAHWDLLVQCVRDTFRPFDFEIVTTDPGPATSHFEVMIGGTSQQLNPSLDAGGVAPFVSCGATRDNVISFVFAETTSDLEFLCGAVAQEASHVWGLDHELNKDDPMTYLDLGSSKRYQNDDAKCGEALSQPRSCRCGGSTQNSYRYLNQTFGLATDLAPPTLRLNTPAEGQWLRPSFPVSGLLTSELTTIGATLEIDGTQVAQIDSSVIAFNAPDTVPAGDHAVELAGIDAGDRTATATVNVHVMAACSAAKGCPSTFHCLGGLCYPGKDVSGGLGATCTENTDCISGSCGDDGSDQLCTAACDGGDSCPSGFSCLGSGDAAVCWPDEGGGCATTGGRSSGFLLFGLGALAFALRRRR